MKTINPSPLKSTKALTLALLTLLLAVGARAQTAANWNFNATLSGTPGSNLTTPAVTIGSAIPSNAFNGGGEFYGQDGWPTGAIDPNAYLQFSVSPNTGYYMVLNTVTMIVRRSNTGTPAGAGPNNWALRSSLDGYTTNLATNSMTYNYATYAVTLPAAFQSLTSGVTFRLYGYNTTINSGGNSRLVLDNISVQGQANAGLLAEQSIDLTAKATTGGANLQWQSMGFAAGTTFTVERSTDGTNFIAIAQQASTEASVYQYADKTAPVSDKVFYRVLASQPDGETLRSAISAVTLQAITGTVIRNVAALGGMVKTVVHLGEAGAYQLNIWSQDGKALHQQTLVGQAGDQVTEINLGNYPHGMYVISVSKNGVNKSRQFVL